MHIVPLSRQVVELLRELHLLTGQHKYLFPSRPRKGQPGAPIRSMSLVFAMRRIGYSHQEMTFHGFRSMASTVLHEQGYNRDWIERQLAHCERNGVCVSYNNLEYLSKRRKMMQTWADYLDGLREKAKQEAA